MKDKAFVFGKFMPFHKGHQAMIEFAASLSDELIVLVCASDKEDLPGKIRVEWIEKTFEKQAGIHVQLLEYKEDDLPNSSESSEKVSEIWSEKFKEILPDVNMLVSSEPYGEYVSKFMGIRHRFFDRDRQIVPISATKIRSELWKYWDFLPDAVKPYYQKKVVILGTESTGKSTLAKFLSDYFDAALVEEAGRELIADSNNFDINDLYAVAARHHENTVKASETLKPLVILDTDLHITQSYAAFSFGEYLNLPEEWFTTQKAHLYLYLEKDVPFVQDGTRMNELSRNELDSSHKKTLEFFGVDFKLVNGNWDQRKLQAINLLNKLL